MNAFERVLSVGYKLDYSTKAIERLISCSDYFQRIEEDKTGFPPMINDSEIIDTLFSEITEQITDVPVYNQCLWAAESYLRIQESSKLSFEAIFLYIPIKKMYEYFDLYHEMDFSQIIGRFNKLYKDKSVLSILIDSFGYSMKDISKKYQISYETLNSFKQRKRDIRKANISTIVKLSKILHVRIETIAEIEL